MVKDKHYASWVEKLPSLEGKTVAITGTTSGTGYWTAVAALRKGAKLVLLLNRKSTRAENSEKKLQEEIESVKSSTQLKSVECDLMRFESVRNAAKEIASITAEHGGLDVLANNAGIMGFPDNRTADGYEVQMQTNHLSHFLLTSLLLKPLQDAAESRGEARVVQHSSGARNMFGSALEEKYFEKSEPKTLGGDSLQQNFLRYHQTKLANSCFALGMHKRLEKAGIINVKSIVSEPGIAATDLASNLGAANKGIGKKIIGAVLGLYVRLFVKVQSPADGALPLIEGCFGANVDGGDFFYPEQRQTGIPYKAISKGEPVKPNSEKLSMDETSQDLLWKKSEEAIGSAFLSDI
uniref:Protochlorophyllide reductase n=1 Tax=Aplanochytrium stocchinoi TaxID=215587 RepID=A0A7S3LJ94_9STRA|mmetsp:Transcript_21557/g.26103  ORF Transcript_21557/g.26103 Transcript_21557/m.26103 type:complete len:351 (-) Transcript_21557:259-1311(-)